MKLSVFINIALACFVVFFAMLLAMETAIMPRDFCGGVMASSIAVALSAALYMLKTIEKETKTNDAE